MYDAEAQAALDAISFDEMPSEAAMLGLMSSWTPLPDEDDPSWEDMRSDAWVVLYSVRAASLVCETKGWREVAIAVFRYAANWDVYELMQSIRHGPEAVWMDDIEGFARRLEELMACEHAGARMWTARELGILRSLGSLAVLEGALNDPDAEVAATAAFSLGMLAQEHPEAERAVVRHGLSL